MKYRTLVIYSLKLFRVEIFLFSFFLLVTILFNIDTNAHKYFNESDISYNFHGFFALLTTVCFAVFFWVCICFPILWLIQLIILIREKYFKQYWKQFLLITVLYLFSLVAWFSLYSIDRHQSFLERRQENTANHKNTDIPLYLFNEEIKFENYDSLSIQSATIEFKNKTKKILRKVIYEKESNYGRIKFESIYDTIRKRDSIILTVNNQKYYFTEIEQKYAKTSYGTRPAFIEYKLDGVKTREGNGVIRAIRKKTF